MTPEEQDRIRRILTDSLPTGREWAIWAEGVLARIFAEGGWREIPNGGGQLANALVLHDERGFPVRRWIRVDDDGAES